MSFSNLFIRPSYRAAFIITATSPHRQKNLRPPLIATRRPILNIPPGIELTHNSIIGGAALDLAQPHDFLAADIERPLPGLALPALQERQEDADMSRPDTAILYQKMEDFIQVCHAVCV